MWEERFSTDDYVFGKAPALFMESHEKMFQAGESVLSVADGEGRNSVWLAKRGLNVTALEFAPSAVEKARKLAADQNVSLTHEEADVFNWDWPTDKFDHVLGVFIQFVGPDDRKRLFDKMKAAVAPGGMIALHGYTPKQLEYKTGGPSALENLYTPEILEDLFGGWDIVENRDYEKELSEGKGHSGRSALIDFVARKP
ncbi:SAM-dependent methyltransferase [Pseudooceanicola sp. MF1-13]|uniref:SAM-dependent methyltransferase n=1 Tax=Pseudooceanicola sp. MF1-13 TaxID=3379095 RepID=UPI0038917CA7